MTNPFREAWDLLAPDFGDVLGGVVVTLRRPSTLRGRTSLSAAGGPASALTLDADAAAGATSVRLKIGAGSLGGTLLAGSRLTIGSTSYASTADAAPVGATIEVAIAPPLVADAATGASVALDSEITYTFAGCILSAASREDVTGDMSGELAAKIAIPVLGSPVPPRMNDIIILEDGRALRIVADPPTTGGWYDCLVGYNRGANP